MWKSITKMVICFFAIVITFIIQINLLNNFNFFGIRPNLILVEVIMVAMIMDEKKSIIFAIIMGIVSDVIFKMNIGNDLLMYLIVSIAVSKFASRYRKDNKIAIIYVTFISIVIFEIMKLAINTVTTGKFINIFVFLKQTIIEAVLSIGISFLIYQIFDKTYLKKQRLNVRISRL